MGEVEESISAAFLKKCEVDVSIDLENEAESKKSGEDQENMSIVDFKNSSNVLD